MGIRWLSLIGIFVAVLTGMALEWLFGAGLIGYTIGLLAAAVVVFLLGRDDVVGISAAVVFVLFAMVVFATAVVRQFRAVGLGTALAIDAPIVAVAAFALWFAFFGRPRWAAVRLCRRAAQSLGWRYRKPDADLLRRVRLAFPTVRDRVRTLYGAVEGSVDGIALTFVTGSTPAQLWLARLPFGLPRISVARPSREPHGAASVESSGGKPAFREALLMPTVVDAMVAGDVAGWRLERDDLVVVLHRANDSAAVGHGAARVASLVRAVPRRATPVRDRPRPSARSEAVGGAGPESPGRSARGRRCRRRAGGAGRELRLLQRTDPVPRTGFRHHALDRRRTDPARGAALIRRAS